MSEAPTKAAPKNPLHSGITQYSAALFLAALVLLIVISPLGEMYPVAVIYEGLVLTAVLISGAMAVGGRKRTLIWALVLIAPALAAKWFSHFRPELVPPAAYLVPAMLFFVLIIASLLRYVLTSAVVTAEVICAAIAAYLMIGILWMSVYTLLDQYLPGSFSFNGTPDMRHSMKGFTALYFSFITLSTVGYGDFAPVSPLARMFAMMEATVGLFYITVLLARLVALYTPTKKAHQH